MSQQLNPADEELLQAALAQSFTRIPTNESTETAPLAEPVPQAPAPAAPAETAPSASTTAEDVYKEEYDRQLAAWRAEADLARAKAERTRAEWEVRRKAEEDEAKKLAVEEESKRKESGLSGWETVSSAGDKKSPSGGIPTSDEKATAERVFAAQSAASQHVKMFGTGTPEPEPSPADARDLTSGERQRTGIASGLSFPMSSPATSRTDPLMFDSETSEDEHDPRISRQWENIPSLASSFPSLPEMSSSSSHNNEKGVSHKDSSKSDPSKSHSHHHHHHHDKQPVQVKPPPSVTLSIFSPGLSPRARALAIASSLAINMLLPFINGVMLGFGEIVAKNIIAPLLGFKPATPSVANVGLRTPTTAAKDKRR